MSNQFRIGADKGNPVAFSRERIVKAQGDNFGKRIGFENRAQRSFDGTCGKSRWTVSLQEIQCLRQKSLSAATCLTFFELESR